MVQLTVKTLLVPLVLLVKESVAAVEKTHLVLKVVVPHQIKVAKKGCIVRSD